MFRPLVVIIGVVLATEVNLSAQSKTLKHSEGRAVFVIDENRQEWQGRLLKVSAEALEVESDAGIRTFKLAEIRRVDADGDGVGDGALKGAAIGAALGLIPTGFGASPLVILSNALWTGLLGLGIDAGCSSRHPVYHGPAVPRLNEAASRGRSLQVSMNVRW